MFGRSRPGSFRRDWRYAHRTLSLRASLVVAFICAAALAQQPRIDSVSPSQGPIAGGTLITISGAHFTGASVKLDRIPIVPQSQTDTAIVIRMSEHNNGYAIVQVKNASGSAYGEYLYVPPKLEDLPPGSITTVAGVGFYDHAYGRATEAMITAYDGCVYDRAGNAYVPDANGSRVYVVHPDGSIEPFAGNGSLATDGNSAGEGRDALDVMIGFPRNVAIDGAGNVYIPDAQMWIRKVGADGICHDFAGTGKSGFSGEGVQAAGHPIGRPTWLVADNDDLFFLEDQVRVRRIHFADGTITTFAGDGTAGFSGDGGPATQARFFQPTDDNGGIALDAAGNVYLLDAGNDRIRRIDRKSGIITTALAFDDPRGEFNLWAFTLDGAGNIYYTPGSYIVKAASDGHVLATYGTPGAAKGYSEDGTPAASAKYGQIYYLGFDPAGNLVFGDASASRARRINFATGKLETIAGMQPAIFAENGAANAAALKISQGGDLAVTPDGVLLIADTGNHRIRRVGADGQITTIAGNGLVDDPADGAAATKTSITPIAIDAGADGIDAIAASIWRLDAKGTFHAISRYQIGGSCQLKGDGGLAINASFCQPWATARDRSGNLFVADTNNNRIRRIDARTGVITTFAGNGNPPNGVEAYGRGKECGDGGPAIDACFNTPYGVAVDGDGNVFVADNWSVIRKIDTNGIVSTVSRSPVTKLRADAAGSVFGAGFDGVWRYDRAGGVTVVAGGNGHGFAGDGGPARTAKVSGFGQSQGVGLDRDGNLFFVDAGNNRVRGVRYGAVLAPPGASVTATTIGMTIGTTIRAVVRHPDGTPAPSVRVDFSAPATGASCAWSAASAVTDVNGVASVVCTSNCIPGSFTATAQPLTATATTTVSLTNSGGPCRRRAVGH